MTWLTTWPDTTPIEMPVRPWPAHACRQVTCDGGHADPRTLVAAYQQKLRAERLPETAERTARGPLWRQALAAYQDARATCERGLRRLRLAEPDSVVASSR